MGKEKEKERKQDQAISSTGQGYLVSPAGNGKAGGAAGQANGPAFDIETEEPVARRYRAKLLTTPEYLQPKTEVGVGEPAIYRSLFILDTFDEPAPSPIFEGLTFEKPKSWKAEGGIGQSTLDESGSQVTFEVIEEKGNGKYSYHQSLLQGASIVSFAWGDNKGKVDATFSFHIDLKTSKRDVVYLQVRKKDYDTEPVRMEGGGIIVPVSEARDGLAVRLDMDRLVQKLLDGETFVEMLALRLMVIGKGSVVLRDFKVSKSETHSVKELNRPIDPFAPEMSEAQTKPAMGVLMVHSQQWKQKGLALGNLLNSVCLAPGEVTRVAVTDWRRTSRGSKQAGIEQGESVSSQIEQSRAVNEVQSAVARETQYGGSSMLAASASAQAGIAMSTLFASGSASASSTASTALTAQFSAGAKNLEASSKNAIDQRTAERSQSLRSRRQTVVQEVSETESETLSTRILANYNRRHSLNIEYFEVLQLYKIETKLAGWERCLFVPMVPLNFTKTGSDGKITADLDVIKRHRPQLISIYRDLGAQEMVQRLLHLEDDQAALAGATKAVTEKIPVLQGAMALATQFPAFAAMSLDPAAKDSFVQGMIAARDNIRTQYNQLATKFGATLPAIDHPQAPSMIDQLIKDQVNKLTSLKLDLGDVLNADRMFLSQQIWLRMSPYRIYSSLQGYHVKAQPISMLVEPYPVGVFGNYLAFRWGFPRSAAGQKARDEFERTYLKQDDTTGSDHEDGPEVALPTSGVFAEAVLGQSVAAEVKDDYHFGTWGEDVIPILPPEIKAIRSRDRSRDMDLSTPDFADPMARLRAKDIADISHIKDIMEHYGEFRDMSGKEEAAMLVSRLAKISGKGATAAGNRAVELHSKMLDTFVEVLNSDVFKAVAAEALAPGVGPALLQASGGGGSKKKAKDGEAGKTEEADSDDDGEDQEDANSGNSGNAMTGNATNLAGSNATGTNAIGSNASRP